MPTSGDMARSARQTSIETGLNGICRAVGAERTVTLMQYMKAARRLEKRIGGGAEAPSVTRPDDSVSGVDRSCSDSGP